MSFSKLDEGRGSTEVCETLALGFILQERLQLLRACPMQAEQQLGAGWSVHKPCSIFLTSPWFGQLAKWISTCCSCMAWGVGSQCSLLTSLGNCSLISEDDPIW